MQSNEIYVDSTNVTNENDSSKPDEIYKYEEIELEMRNISTNEEIGSDIQIINDDKETTIQDKTNNKILNSRCTACGYQATKGKRKNSCVLSCCKCAGLVHFPCSKLPPYMLYNLSNTSKRYTCEVCVVNFLEETIQDNLKNYDQITIPAIDNTHSGENFEQRITAVRPALIQATQ